MIAKWKKTGPLEYVTVVQGNRRLSLQWSLEEHCWRLCVAPAVKGTTISVNGMTCKQPVLVAQSWTSVAAALEAVEVVLARLGAQDKKSEPLAAHMPLLRHPDFAKRAQHVC